MKLKNWVENLLLGVVASYICFVALTIESLGNNTYNIILIVWSILALGSVNLLIKYSRIF